MKDLLDSLESKLCCLIPREGAEVPSCHEFSLCDCTVQTLISALRVQEKAFWTTWCHRVLAADPHARFGFFGSPSPFAPGYNPYSEDIDMTFWSTTYKADCALNAQVFSPFITHVFPAFYPSHPHGFANDLVAAVSETLRLQRTYYPKAKIVPYLTQQYVVVWEETFGKYAGDNYVKAMFEVLCHVPEITEVIFFPLGATNGDGTPNAEGTKETLQFISAAQPYLR